MPDHHSAPSNPDSRLGQPLRPTALGLNRNIGRSAKARPRPLSKMRKRKASDEAARAAFDRMHDDRDIFPDPTPSSGSQGASTPADSSYLSLKDA